MMYAVVQNLLIAVVVAFSAVQMLRRLLPQTSRTMQGRAARMLHLKWLEPVSASPKGCGSDDGCGGCKGCASIAALSKDLPPKKA
jgi:hypothetical protein